MAVLKYIVPALAAAGYATAASCSASGTSTIQSAADATALAQNCRTFTGSIAIATGTADSIDLSGLTSITGDLVAVQAVHLPSLSSSSLSSIGGMFGLNQLTGLTNLAFPMLTSVGSLNWQTLNSLQNLGLSTNPGLTKVNSLTISDTQLNSLQGINVQTAQSISINNNQYLNMINLPLNNVSELDITANGAQLQILLSNLQSVANITIGQATSIMMPSLAAINGTAGFRSNSFESLSAPNLTSVVGTLAIDENNSLTNASFPLLKTLGGGLQIQNNTNLDQITGFPTLQRVVGAVDIYGPFSNVTLPALNYVRGDFNLQSSKDITTACNYFKPMAGSGKAIQGAFTCYGNQKTPNTTGTQPTGSSGNGSSNNGGSQTGSAAQKTSTSAANPILIPGATGLLGVVAAIFGLL